MSIVVLCMWMDGQTDMRKVLVTSHSFANTPKNNAMRICLILRWVHRTQNEMWDLCTINFSTIWLYCSAANMVCYTTKFISEQCKIWWKFSPKELNNISVLIARSEEEILWDFISSEAGKLNQVFHEDVIVL